MAVDPVKTPQPAMPPRAIRTEKKTVAAMVRLYCAERHGAERGHADLCEACQALLTYSHAQLDGCPYGADKPSCRDCPVHCYRAAEKEQMRDVMRATGPRMLFRHPWLAIVHLWKERGRGTPPPAPRRSGAR